MAAAICASGFFFILGVMHIFSPDDAWDIQEKRNKASGKKSERTDEWEQANMLGGIGLIILAILIIIYAILVS